jgi:hypothetical protein
MIDYFIDEDIIRMLFPGEEIESGTIVRRVSDEKDQQGTFTRYDNKGGLILINVINMKDQSFLAETAILRPEEGDQLYAYNTRFDKRKKSQNALKIINEWALFKRHPELNKAMLNFITTTFVPEQIITYKENKNIKAIFVPVQQKFKIGKFEEVIDWNKLCDERFQQHLDNLLVGGHLTYIAVVPQSSSYKPFFYSIGTKPHQSTAQSLESEPFAFKPTHGGHIKKVKEDDTYTYMIDAGSDHFGKGIKTKLKTAKEVTDAMSKKFKGYTFVPLEGRGAFGHEQSY